MLFPSVEFTSKIFCERLSHKIDYYSSWLQKESWCHLDAGAPGKHSLTANRERVFFAVFPPPTSFLKTNNSNSFLFSFYQGNPYFEYSYKDTGQIPSVITVLFRGDLLSQVLITFPWVEWETMYGLGSHYIRRS